MKKPSCSLFYISQSPMDFLQIANRLNICLNHQILFSAILRRPGPVLHPLLPPLKTTGYHLRKCSHGLKLSAVQSSFLERILYIECYTQTFIETVYF